MNILTSSNISIIIFHLDIKYVKANRKEEDAAALLYFSGMKYSVLRATQIQSQTTCHLQAILHLLVVMIY